MESDRENLTASSHALRATLAGFRSYAAWRASPQADELQKRLDRHLDGVRRFTPDAPGVPAPDRGWVHVVHWNILHGLHFEAVLEALAGQPALAGADLVSLNEVDLGLARTGNRDIAFEMGAALGLHAVWAPLFLEVAAGHRTPPEVAARPQGELLFGLALLSRWPLGSVRRIPLVSPVAHLFDRERKAGSYIALAAEVQRPGAPFHAVVTHLDVHGSPADRLAQVQQILAAIPAGPVALCGDLNTTTFARGGSLRALRTLAFMALAPRRLLEGRLLAPHAPAGRAREPLFDALQAAGMRVAPFNDCVPSLDLRFDDLHELDFLPAGLRRRVISSLAAVERRTALRLDWISARGFDAAPERPPRALHALLQAPHPPSDHAPITCGLRQRGS